MSDDDITCPFCGDIGFDKIGLKMHLENWCDEYKKISCPLSIMNMMLCDSEKEDKL